MLILAEPRWIEPRSTWLRRQPDPQWLPGHNQKRMRW